MSEITVKLFALPGDVPGWLEQGFVAQASGSIQLSLGWYQRLAEYGLPASQNCFIAVAMRSEADFVACALRFDSSKGLLASLSSYYSAEYLPVLASGDPRPLLSCLLRELRETLKPVACRIEPMPGEPAMAGEVLAALKSAGWFAGHVYDKHVNWFQTTAESSYAAYEATLPAALRSTIARKRRKFDKVPGARIVVIAHEDELPRALADYHTVYKASWKGDEPFPAFIDSVAAMAAAQGQLRLAFAYVDDRPIAAQLWFVVGGRAEIFKLAYDPAYRAYSPGTILMATLCDHVMSRDRVTELNFLVGDEIYKRHWMSARQLFVGISCYEPRTLQGLWSGTLQLVKYSVKRRTRIFRWLRSRVAG